MSVHPHSLFNQMEEQIHQLSTSRKPLGIDGSKVHPDLPQRFIPMMELRSVLLHPSTPYVARDAAMQTLIKAGKQGNNNYITALLMMMTPAFRQIAGLLIRQSGADAADVEAEIIAAALETINTLNPSAAHIAASLRWAAYRRGRTFCESGGQEEVEFDNDEVVVEFDDNTCSHPDFVLREAVQENVISNSEAELIGATRLDRHDLNWVARRTNSNYGQTQRRRHRAEARLVAWIGEK